MPPFGPGAPSGRPGLGPAVKEPSKVVWSLKQAYAFLPEFLARLTIRRDSGPIDCVDSLCAFVSTRAAFVAQKTLYGYLKTRMGTRYPSLFEDDVFVASINLAKMHVFVACLADLAVYAAAWSLRAEPVEDSLRRDLASHCFRKGLADNAAQAQGIEGFSLEESEAEFQRRLSFQDWHSGPTGAAFFTASPAALYHWAPIAPKLKKDDKEIVENSIKYTWREVRSQFDKRIRGAILAADLNGLPPSRT